MLGTRVEAALWLEAQLSKGAIEIPEGRLSRCQSPFVTIGVGLITGVGAAAAGTAAVAGCCIELSAAAALVRLCTIWTDKVLNVRASGHTARAVADHPYQA